MHLAVVHNPSAGDGTEGDQIERAARRHGHRVDLLDSGGAWLEQLSAGRADLVVVAGGDGTVRDVLTTLSTEAGATPVALLPLGTANNIARALGLDVDAPWHEVASWGTPSRRPVDFDVAVVDDGHHQEPFVESFGGGVVAAALASAEDAPEQTDDGNEHGRQHLIETFEQLEPAWWWLVVDGEDRSGEYLAVEVMNVPTVGPILPLAPSARPDDGRLDVVCITASDRALLRSTIAGCSDGSELELLGGARATSLQLTPPRATAMHLDDELFVGDGAPRRVALRGRTVPVLGACRPDDAAGS